MAKKKSGGVLLLVSERYATLEERIAELEHALANMQTRLAALEKPRIARIVIPSSASDGSQR